ncbi:hypothetical protein V1478_013218 [Vespula squamosa]|uniref:Uncharacterized protein n=1 Tax=Vespula squamosa TaxID=30214 RepID=A0ABD2AA77_VESSQ
MHPTAYPKLSLCRSAENGGLTRTRGIEPLATHTPKGFQPLFIEREGGEEGGGCGGKIEKENSKRMLEQFRCLGIGMDVDVDADVDVNVYAREDAKVWKARGDMEEMVGEENSCGRSSSKFQERDAARGPVRRTERRRIDRGKGERGERKKKRGDR